MTPARSFVLNVIFWKHFMFFYSRPLPNFFKRFYGFRTKHSRLLAVEEDRARSWKIMECTRKQDVDCEVGNCMNLICRDYRVIQTPSAFCNTCQSESSWKWKWRIIRHTKISLHTGFQFRQRTWTGIWIMQSRYRSSGVGLRYHQILARLYILQQEERWCHVCQIWMLLK